MNISLNGQKRLIKIISTRLTGLNIDEIAKLLSSNVCENHFSCLTKYTQGQRINVDFTDTWRVQQAFVAGIISDSNFLSDLMDKVGVQEYVLRNERLSTLSSIKGSDNHGISSYILN